MSTNSDSTESAPRGLSGSVRAVAACCVLMLAVLGVLVVLEVVPRSVFAEAGVKVLAVGAIGLVTALALGLLARR
jgi:hypothetical protein